jgi:uncharacterized protein (TIGR00255 family)
VSGRKGIVKSMTGFGQGSAEANGMRLDVELRGVNHRYFDLKLKLPAALAPHEFETRARVQRVVRRGRIDIAVTQISNRMPSYRVEVNRPLVSEYLTAAGSLKKAFRLRGSIQLQAVVALPGALSIQERSETTDGDRAALFEQAVDSALEAYDAMRTEEGRRLAEDIRGRLSSIDEDARDIEAELRGLPEEFSVKLRERVGRLLQGQPGLDPARIAQEIAIMASRVDVTEELVRLKGYVEQAGTTLDRGDGPLGKELDFIMQEMNREANTIASKSEALPICQAALRIRSAVEKIREQVQNLE